MADDYLEKADVWVVLDLIAAEFRTDPTSVQCFDRRLVNRAIALVDQHVSAVADPDRKADRDALALALAILSLDRPGWHEYLRGVAGRYAIAASDFDHFRRMSAPRWRRRKPADLV